MFSNSTFPILLSIPKLERLEGVTGLGICLLSVVLDGSSRCDGGEAVEEEKPGIILRWIVSCFCRGSLRSLGDFL